MSKRKHDARQLAFEFDLDAEPIPTLSDPIEALKAAGIFGKLAYYCSSWGTVRDASVPYSPRSISFPCNLLQDDKTGAWRLDLTTPANASNGLVQRIAEITGLKPQWSTEGRGMDGRWHHAVDLAEDKGIDRLLASLEHTTSNMALTAIGHGVHYGRLSLGLARKALATLNVCEPDDRSHALLARDGMNPCRSFGGPNICTGHQFTAEQRAWAEIHAIEDGWVTKPTVDKDGNTKRYSVVTNEGWRRRGEEPPPRYAKAA